MNVQFCYVKIFSIYQYRNLVLLDDPGRVRSQITNVVYQIQRFDFDCILVVSRKVIIRIPPVLGRNPLYLRGRISLPGIIITCKFASYKYLQAWSHYIIKFIRMSVLPARSIHCWYGGRAVPTYLWFLDCTRWSGLSSTGQLLVSLGSKSPKFVCRNSN